MKFLPSTEKPCITRFFHNCTPAKNPIHPCIFSIFAICDHPFRMSFFIIYSTAENPPSLWMGHFQFSGMQTFVETIFEIALVQKLLFACISIIPSPFSLALHSVSVLKC